MGFFSGLIFGSIVGAGVALFLSPQTGEVTRTKLREQKDMIKNTASERIADMRGKPETLANTKDV